MDFQVKGKLAYISAGSTGIGEAIANLLTKEGAKVIVSARNPDTLKEKGGAWHGTVSADIATPQGVQKAVDYVVSTFGRAPDILINNLGVADATPFEQMTDERWEHSLNVNLMGNVRTLRALLPLMAKLEGSAVVNTGSDLAKQPEFTLTDYGSCKAALLYLTKALSKQYAWRPRINVISPGPVWTAMFWRPGGIIDQVAAQYGVDRDTAKIRFLEDRQMPMGMPDPEDVAYAAVFLASPLAKFINGANIDIGGTLRGLI
jgi:NAD(P)-dependent dehydrogenase (short-subunit alcohol dehydrogenase family)